ncbi:MAG: hypothetical protein IJL24_00320 [Treponema sp.]|nr:hypothetical protein [Treponema sp.]
MKAKVFSQIKKFRLQILLAFLAALYFLSAPRSEKSFTTALLNPKHKVQKIVLGNLEQGKLVLQKTGGFWLGKKNAADQKDLFFASASALVESFLSVLKRISTVYEVSNTLNLKAYGLDEGGAFFLGLYDEMGKDVLTLHFGSVDSQRRLYFFVPKRNKIFSIDSEALAPYLNLDINLWASAEIFPKDIVGSDKKYRRGKLASLQGQPLLADGLNWQDALAKDYDAGDGNIYRAFFLPKTDGDYYYRFEAQPSAQRPGEEKEALKKINAVFNVSAWTFERVMEQE